MLTVAFVAAGIAVEFLDAPGHAAKQPVQEEVQRRLRSRVAYSYDWMLKFVTAQTAGRMAPGQAVRLPVAAVLRAAFNAVCSQGKYASRSETATISPIAIVTRWQLPRPS